MKLEDCWKLSPLADEVFSSWLYRQSLHSRWSDKITALNGLFESPEYTASYFDPDYDIEGEDFLRCCRSADVDVRSAQQLFVRPTCWAAPRKFRQAYCMLCMEESYRVCGAPIYKRSWGLMMAPFCMVHGVLLRNGNYTHKNTMNLGVSLFKQHWSSRAERIDFEVLDRLYPWLPLAMKVQQEIGQPDGDFVRDELKVLMQLFLSHQLDFVSNELSRNVWGRAGGVFSTVPVSARSAIHLNAISACTVVRAKALCYLGRTLDLITDQEMRTGFGDSSFMPNDLDSMIAHLAGCWKSDVISISRNRLQALSGRDTKQSVRVFVEALSYALKV